MESEAPAWMLCEDMITRLKDELVLEAADILHKEIEEGRIDVSGYVALFPEKSQELQRDLFVINELVQRQNEILEQYKEYIEKNDESDPDRLKSIERLKKFILSVKAIGILMQLSGIAELWAEDTGRYSKSTDPIQILANSARMADDRMKVIDFALSSKKFAKSEALKESELEMLRKARKLLKP